MVLRKGNLIYSIIKIIGFIIFKLYFRLKVYGLEKSHFLKGPFILVSNHQSYLDPIVLGVAFKRHLRFVAKNNLFKNFIFGNLISCLGAIPVKLQHPNIRLIKEIYNIFQKGEVLAIFPEGARSPEGIIQKGKPGIGYLINKTRVPVVPAFIDGSGKAFPISSWFIRPYKVKVIFGAPIKIDDFYDDSKLSGGEKYRLITDIIMNRIRELAIGYSAGLQVTQKK